MRLLCRCYYCSAVLDHGLEEFYFDLEGAVEEAVRRGGERIPLACAGCTEAYNRMVEGDRGQG